MQSVKQNRILNFPTAAIFIMATQLLITFHVQAQAVKTEDSNSIEDLSQTNKENINWRKDPKVKRHPASYLGGSLNYQQLYSWLDENKDHKKLTFGPLSGFAPTFRVGDAFAEFFTIGFQVQFLIAKTSATQISSLAILLDATFYPWRGLGIRPSAGFGFSFTQGKNQWEFGSGGPGTLALALLYEFRISRYITIAPIVHTTYIASDGYKSLALLFGVEMTAWFKKH
ncbi:MAG: hypothetical protein JXR91_01115 [Deltaproteobacteria bacterium]|nr:hypothetical protein [Deltaproteobacteria bacterium]